MHKETSTKTTLHPRNKHRERYDFEALIKAEPSLAAFVGLNKYKNESIDFANPDAVKALNKALLKFFYRINFWDIPAGYLCPPVPGRADYLHYGADLLGSCNQGKAPIGVKIKVLDIGVGANCIYPIIGHQTYGWQFVGSEIDDLAVRNATHIVAMNKDLQGAVVIRMQKNKSEILKNIIHKEERFDLTICNPPFHASAEEAMAGSQRKNRNLGNKNYVTPVLNFGGQHHELWTKGGELVFIAQMIKESVSYGSQCFWFSSLISKSENLEAVYVFLKRAGAMDVRTNEMITGNKITRIVAWTFMNEQEQKEWVKFW
jgi:23S rRNA (adenine1618-N6)-methyltransferase